MVKLNNVMQGSADVLKNGVLIGSVSRRYGRNGGWFAYGKDGKRISDDPSPKRDMAVKEVSAADCYCQQVPDSVRATKEFQRWLRDQGAV